MKYIDSKKLIAEIERQQRRLVILSNTEQVDIRRDCALQNGVYTYILGLITTLQQEQPEEQFEDKFTNFLERKDAELGANSWSEEDLRELAEYFYFNNKQPKVDLEKELNKWRHRHFKGKRDGDYDGEYLERESQLDIARYFWNKGYNAGTEE